jgi:Ca-activated chloride channel family protein
LPENAAVDHLLMTVGERKIEGQIKHKVEAKQIYLQTKAQGKKASLIAQQRPNMFSNSIANIGPGETIRVSIEYQQKLNFEQQQYSLRFPMTIAPRYLPGNSPRESHIQTTFSQSQYSRQNTDIELRINLHAGFEVLYIKVNSILSPSKICQMVAMIFSYLRATLLTKVLFLIGGQNFLQRRIQPNFLGKLTVINMV